MDFNQLITAIVTNGIGAVCAAAVVWLSYFRETRTIPKMLETFAQVQKEMTDSQSRAAKETSEMYAKSMSNMADKFASCQKETMDLSLSLVREERSICQKWHEENRAALNVLLQETRENKHYLADLAHMMGVRRAVEEEQAKKQNARHNRADPLP